MNPDVIKVLVVDDDADIASITAGLLDQAGYLTATASDGVDALEAIQTSNSHYGRVGKKAFEEVDWEIWKETG